MIDLRVAPKAESEKLIRIRRLTKTFTTVILGAYLVSVAGFVGWWWYRQSRQNFVSNKVVRLSQELQALAPVEVNVRAVEARSKLAKNFLDARGTVAEEAGYASQGPIIPSGWEYGGGKMTAKLETNSMEEVRAYTEYLLNRYANVRLESANFSSQKGWLTTVSYSGRNKE